METILAASAVICDEAGRVLLVLRGRDPQRGRWLVPGGKVEPGRRLRRKLRMCALSGSWVFG